MYIRSTILTAGPAVPAESDTLDVALTASVVRLEGMSGSGWKTQLRS